MPSARDCGRGRRPAGHSQRLRFNSNTRGHAGSVAIEKQTLIMKSSLWAAPKSLELGTPTVARLGQPTEVAGEWRPPLPSTPTRCSWCRGSFPSRALKEGSQRGAVTTLCTWRRSCSCCRAAQQEKPAELAGREPSAGGGGYGRPARLGAARAHGEAARGAANVLLGSISTFTGQPLAKRATPYIQPYSRGPTPNPGSSLHFSCARSFARHTGRGGNGAREGRGLALRPHA